MAKAPDGLTAALQRLDQMLERRDPRTREILSYHSAIEQQMDAELAKCLADGPHLRTRLGFRQKVDVLLAAIDNPFMPDLALALHAFNDLRNSVAHGDDTIAIDKHFQRLDRELQKTFKQGDAEPTSLHVAAAMIVATLASLNDVEVMIALLGGE